MTMIPCEVVTAQTEYSFSPKKYRLSKTLTGSACHVSRAGGPGRGAFVLAVFAGGGGRSASAEQILSNNPGNSFAPAARAAATCDSTVSAGACAHSIQPASTRIKPAVKYLTRTSHLANRDHHIIR